MSTYIVTDTNGYAITDGVQSAEIDRVAQSIADRRGETVYVSCYHRDEADEIVTSKTRPTSRPIRPIRR